MIVLVEQHARERVVRLPVVPAPEAGARWGKPARLVIDQPAEEAEMARRGGIVLTWPAEHIETVVVEDLTPVWRKVERVRIRSGADPDQSEEAIMTRELLLPVGTSTQSYVGGGVGHVEDTSGYIAETRTIHSFVRLRIPSPVPEAELIAVEEEGDWPDLPEEPFPPGRLVPLFPLPGAWDR